MQITLNGEKKEFASVNTLSELLEQLSLDAETVVIELNTEIIQPDSYNKQKLTKDDSVEIIRFVGGG